jgi:multidrug efflux pump subunit AcrA (membrane-fusion protein)
METIAAEASLALSNASQHHQVAGLRTSKVLGKPFAKLRSTVATAAAILIGVLIVAASLIQVDHYVVATGRLEPTLRREVFAPIDGLVESLHVVDGQKVQPGDLLFTLENADLESQADALASEIQTATQRLRSLATIQLTESGHGGGIGTPASIRGVMEQRQLTSELANLRRQQSIVQKQLEKLSITAPIQGQVVAWQLDRQLRGRPVDRGDRLVSITDPCGSWSLNLNIRDDKAGPVLATSQQGESRLVSFAIATLPSNTFQAELQSVSTATRSDASGKQVLDAIATVVLDPSVSASSADRFDPSIMQSGADVTAKIRCGRQSILHRWFGGFFDFVYRNVLFYF